MERLTVAQMIDELIEREGGFVDHPADRGGPTKYGITQKSLYPWNSQSSSIVKAFPFDVRSLKPLHAVLIYEHMYYRDPGINQLPKPWQPLVFDWAVNSGPAT